MILIHYQKGSGKLREKVRRWERESLREIEIWILRRWERESLMLKRRDSGFQMD